MPLSRARTLAETKLALAGCPLRPREIELLFDLSASTADGIELHRPDFALAAVLSKHDLAKHHYDPRVRRYRLKITGKGKRMVILARDETPPAP